MTNRQKTKMKTWAILLFFIVLLLWGISIKETGIAPHFDQQNLSPNFNHLFGTDWLGRDMLNRTIKGLSFSMFVGIIASSLSAIMALLIGTAAALLPRWVDDICNWLIDLVMGIPHLILLILISFALGRGVLGVTAGIALTHWPSLARIIRAEVLQLRQEDYLHIARHLGKSNYYLLQKHILPHILPQFLTGLILLFPHAILHEAAITFLGFGLSPETPAIGIILSESMRYLSSGYWYLAFFPGFTLLTVVYLFDRLGHFLQNLYDPYHAQD